MTERRTALIALKSSNPLAAFSQTRLLMQRCIEVFIVGLLLTPAACLFVDKNHFGAGETNTSRLAFFSTVPVHVAPAPSVPKEPRRSAYSLASPQRSPRSMPTTPLSVADAKKKSVSKTAKTSNSYASKTAQGSFRFVQRVDHANELLGRHYTGSIVRTTESVKRIESTLIAWTKDSLPKAYRNRYKKIAQTILDEASRYGFDPVFLMAVISTESSFNPKARGSAGEIGLMQIVPSTGQWIALQSGAIAWKGEKTLEDPIKNIKIGAWYLNWLRDKFDSHARLYLAAYNMGLKNVHRALDKRIWPKDYPSDVMKNYVAYYSDLKMRLEIEKKKKRATLARNDD